MVLHPVSCAHTPLTTPVSPTYPSHHPCVTHLPLLPPPCHPPTPLTTHPPIILQICQYGAMLSHEDLTSPPTMLEPVPIWSGLHRTFEIDTRRLRLLEDTPGTRTPHL